MRQQASAVALVATLLASGGPAASLAQRRDDAGRAKSSEAESALSPAHREFLAVAELLLGEDERRAFLALEHDYERDELIRAFWAARDPDPSTHMNELRESWLERIALARRELGEIRSERAQVLLFNGMPDERREGSCVSFLNPVDAWTYRELPQIGEAVLIFAAPFGSKDFTLWRPYDGPRTLVAGAHLVGMEDWWRALPNAERQRLVRRLRLWLTVVLSRRAEHVVYSLGLLNPCHPESGVCAPDRDQFFLFFLGLMQYCPTEGELARLALEAIGLDRVRPLFAKELTEPPDGHNRPESDWLERFVADRTAVTTGARELPARLEVAYGGRHGSRTVVESTIHVSAAAMRATTEPPPSYRLRVNGEVLREDELFETFSYVFELPAEGPFDGEGDESSGEGEAEQGVEPEPQPDATAKAMDELDLVFERYLRPGDFRLILRVVDLEGGGSARLEQMLEVPAPGVVAGAGADIPDDVIAGDERAASGAVVTLEVPGDSYVAGYNRVSAGVVGPRVGRVAFLLDGAVIGAKNRPPFSLELDFGAVPRPMTLEAVAYDDDGDELGRDLVELNRGEHRFAVRIVEPRDGEQHDGTVRLRADVVVPDGARLERVDVFLDERRVASLFEEPYVLPVRIGGSGIALLRCVAVLADGNSTEDAVLLNAPGQSERLAVQLVEVHAAFLRDGRPVAELDPAAVTVLEDGVPQEILRFERIQDLPLHLGVLVDTSASMEKSLMAARSAALTFFEQNVRPKDRVFVTTFHEHPQLRVPFTNDLETMKSGLRVLAAGRGTAFFDSLVFALYQFAGIRGPRALLVLSDGRDEDSRFTFDDTLELARRSGVPLYTIALKVEKTGVARSKLTELAAETGGRAIVLRDIEELLPIYEEIEEELRSRYLIAYQTAVEEGDLQFRRIEVTVDDPELEVRSPAGYYP